MIKVEIINIIMYNAQRFRWNCKNVATSNRLHTSNLNASLRGDSNASEVLSARIANIALAPHPCIRDLNSQTIPIMPHVTVTGHSYVGTHTRTTYTDTVTGVGLVRSATSHLLDTQRLRAGAGNYATSKASPPSAPEPSVAAAPAGVNIYQ